VTWASRQINRPVKWTAERSESFLSDAHGRDHLTHAELALDKDGKFLAMRVQTTASMGAYLSTFASCIPTILYATLLAGQYTTPLIYCEVTAVFTNTAPVDAYRGAGRPEATYAIERAIEALARAIGEDSVETRRRNFIATDRFPYTSAAGLTFDSGDYGPALTRALELVGYDQLRAEQLQRRGVGDTKQLGIGLSSYVEMCGLAPSRVLASLRYVGGGWEAATVRVLPTGGHPVVYGEWLHAAGKPTVVRVETTPGRTTTTTSYTYDGSDRLASVRVNGRLTETDAYDAAGNRVRSVTPAGSTVGSYDARDRLTRAGADTYAWAPDGSGLYFDADDHGARNIQFASIVGGVKPMTTGRRMLSFDSVSKDLVAAGILSDLDHPQDVVRVNLRQPGQVTKLTDVNGDVMQGKQVAKIDEVTYTSSGNAKVMGWIVKPPTFDPSKKYPLILEIHGGPFGNYNVGFNYMFQNFAANGFVVLVTNPRGSTGYGSEFINGIDHNYPGPDYDDLMAGVDAVVGKGYVDTARMYVSGCSGGGVLSSWVIGHTDRFAAAAVRCPVIDWISMAGQTDIPLFTYSFFKKPFWDDPSDWLAHSSLMTVGKVTTPTLLMTGVLDRRTPMPQTEEYYSALKVKGVPVKLLQFNEEYHGTGSKPSNYIRTQLYMMSWFNKYTRQAGGRITTASEQP
jgi:YD repeat-containing protein